MIVVNPGYRINHTSSNMQIRAGISKITFRLSSRRSSLAGGGDRGEPRREQDEPKNSFSTFSFPKSGKTRA